MLGPTQAIALNPTCGRKNHLFRVPYYGFYIEFLKKVGFGGPR